MGAQHVKNGTLSMRRQKTGTPFDIPLLPDLVAELALHSNANANATVEQLTFLVTEPHGLRKASAVRHAMNGATAAELMAWHGWRSIAEAQRYVEEADRLRLAESAAAKMRTNIGSPSDPVSQNDPQAIEITGGAK